MNSQEPLEILLVEDNPHDVELTLRAFGQTHLANKIHVVTDGAEALDFVFCKGAYSKRNIKVPPKLILLDLKLPRVEGKEVLKQVKSCEETKIIPIVVMTASQQESDLIASYHLGANSYIVKPINFEKFVNMVAEIGLYWLVLNKTPF